jgi:hypothetical protein
VTAFAALGTTRAFQGFPVEVPMSKEKPTDDPRRQTDWKTTKQTDQPWKGPGEKEQQSGARKEDLERWKDSNTR